MKSFLNKISILGVLACFSFSCDFREGDSLQNDKNSSSLTNAILIQSIQSQGNCLVSITRNSEVTKTCNRRPRAICNSQIAITTRAEINLLLFDQNEFRTRFPNCTESIGFSGVLSLRESTQEEKDSIAQNNRYETVDSCEGSGFSSSKRISTITELAFLQTAKGRIGQGAERIVNNRLASQASKDTANQCLNDAFSEAERSYLQGLSKGDILLEFP